jgi:hypothetical protein
MKKLYVLKKHPVKPGNRGFTKQELEASLDMSRVVEDEIRFDQSFLYHADSPEDMVEKMSHSVFGPNLPVSAREFTDEEYKKAFERSADRKVEWLGEKLGLGLDDARSLFNSFSNKKLDTLVEALAGKTIPAISYK